MTNVREAAIIDWRDDAETAHDRGGRVPWRVDGSGSSAAWSSCRSIRHADLVVRASRQQSRTMDAAAKRGDILDRRGRVLATSVDADSVIAVPSAIEDPPAVVDGAVRRPGRLQSRRARRPDREARQDAGVRVRQAAGLAGTGPPRRGAEPRRHRVHEGGSPLLPEQGAGGAPARLRRHRQHRAERPRIHLRRPDSRQGRNGAGPDRRAPPCVQPVRASSDHRLERRADG